VQRRASIWPMISLGRAAARHRAAGRASLLLAVLLWLPSRPACDARNLPSKLTSVSVGTGRGALASRQSAQQMADMQLLQQFASSELQHRRRRHLQQVDPSSLRTCLFSAS